MRYKFISRENNNRLILIYAGWGMDWRVFRHMRRHGYDIIIVWDYRQLTFDWSVVASYDEICLVAWSMGVFAASVTIHEILPRITKSIAVGGTPDPISDTLGIPVEIYRGTAEGLNAGNLRKFHRRMCLDAGHYSAFREVAPRRDISSLRDELYALETHTIFHAPQVCRWDLAIIGRHDRIFPPANQMRAWRDKAPTVITEGAHLPDMQSIMTIISSTRTPWPRALPQLPKHTMKPRYKYSKKLRKHSIRFSKTLPLWTPYAAISSK